MNEEELATLVQHLASQVEAEGWPTLRLKKAHTLLPAEEPSLRVSFDDSTEILLIVNVNLHGSEQQADVASQLQDFLVEEAYSMGMPAVWPVCPHHPDTHPLTPVSRGDRAVWSCPASGEEVAVVP